MISCQNWLRNAWLLLLLLIWHVFRRVVHETHSSTSSLSSSASSITTTRTPHETNAVQQLAALLPLRTCSVSAFTLPKQEFDFDLEYQCAGPLYDNFTLMLAAFASNHTRHGPFWGRRPTIVPPNSTVLFLGNSHTKQTHNELVCQYAEAVTGFQGLHSRPGVNGTQVSDFTSYVLHFDQGISIYLVYNSPVEIARNWRRRLESIVQRSLSSFDAVVLGQFNGAGRDIQNTAYYRTMMNWSLEENDGNVKIDPPDVIRLAKHFHGPIIFVSNYDIGKLEPAIKIQQVMGDISEQNNRSNLVGILSRRYIEELDGNECGSDVRFSPRSDGNASAQPLPDCGVLRKGSHRCVGKKGAHPTLIAHDVQEALFDVLNKSMMIRNAPLTGVAWLDGLFMCFTQGRSIQYGIA